jgi:hypothetical protein
VGRNWFYDGRWSPIVGYQPSNNEVVGLFAGSGNLRDATYGPGICPGTCERTNVALVPWHNDDPALYTFGASGLNATPLSILRKR